MQCYLVKITALLLPLLFGGQLTMNACPNDGDQSKEQQANQTTTGINAVTYVKLKIDKSEEEKTTSKPDCCTVCKVNLMALQYPFPLTNMAPFVKEIQYPSQTKSCRNANEGIWQPPKNT